MIAKKKFLLLWVISVIAISLIISTSIVIAEIIYFMNDEGFNVQIDRIYPEGISNALLANPLVLNYTEEGGYTIILINISGAGITEGAIIDYLESLEYLFERNKHQKNFFPGYPIPNCWNDEYTHLPTGIYMYNNTFFTITNDSKCY